MRVYMVSLCIYGCICNIIRSKHCRRWNGSGHGAPITSMLFLGIWCIIRSMIWYNMISVESMLYCDISIPQPISPVLTPSKYILKTLIQLYSIANSITPDNVASQAPSIDVITPSNHNTWRAKAESCLRWQQ